MNKVIQQLAESLPLSTNYTWEMPAKLPITIPQNINGEFERNVYLKENLKDVFNRDDDWKNSFWVIQEWGGIKTFKKTEQNLDRIAKFYYELKRGVLTKDIHDRLPSLSKLAAFRWPEKYSIYDSRAIFSLNWLLFCHTKEPNLFPQPTSRNKSLIGMNTQTLFKLSGRPYKFRSHTTAYFDYCKLLSQLSRDVLGEKKPYYVEMLLFVAALSWIPEDIKKRTTITIKANG